MRTALVLLIFAGLIAVVLVLAPEGEPAGVPDGVARDIIDGTDGDDLLEGSDGYDELRGFEGNDSIYGYGGPDNLWGGDNGDFLKGGAGDDALFGGQGPDELNTASDDSAGDFVSCGDGWDHVRADPSDAVALNCEDVNYVF